MSAAIISASFTSRDILPQHFPFSKPVMTHIFDNANSKLFKKFNQSCKYFFAKFGYNFIDHFRFLDYLPCNGIFENYKFQTNNIKKLSLLSDKLWLTEKFQVYQWIPLFYDILIPKVFRFEIKELVINNSPNLSFKHFKILTESGTVKSLKLHKTQIFYPGENTSLMVFDEISECVPNAVSISINPCHTVTKDPSEFTLIQRKFKLTEIVLQDIMQPLISELAEFLMNNVCDPTGNMPVEFQNPINTYLLKLDLTQKMVQNLNNKMTACEKMSI